MQRKPLFWYAVSLLCLCGAIYFWRLGDRWQAQKVAKVAIQPALVAAVVPPALTIPVTSSTPIALVPSPKTLAAKVATNDFPYRLKNTDQSLTQLIHNDKAILLANALIDTGKPHALDIPERLRAPANNGSYVVQSRGALDDQFRALLRNANATIVSYIPNNAYLVRVSADGAQQIQGNPQTQSVLAFEPYYKLDAPLLKLAMEDADALPPGGLTVTVFPDSRDATLAALKQMGAEIAGEDHSPFGPVLRVYPAEGTLSQVASLPGVQGVAALHTRKAANDISRPRLGVSLTTTNANYLDLTGSNIVLNINDFGVDTNHPDLKGRFTADSFPGTDVSGHGTHVTGTIMGSGIESSMVTNAPGSGTNFSFNNFRGIAPSAKAFVESLNQPDFFLQEQAALEPKVYISNNSWNYSADSTYDIAAASYDAAVRDALPEATGSQALVYVFSAGNDGLGATDGTQATPDTILSPATAKNVITVGAIEQPRFITNQVVINGHTNTLFLSLTDSSNQVASFSSRGNVGVNVEGTAGRFKPDVVAPGTFVISDRSEVWDQNAYYNPTNTAVQPLPNLSVKTNKLTLLPPIFLPTNAVGFKVFIVTNEFSPANFPTFPIYLGVNKTPTTNAGGFAFVGTNANNSLSLPQDFPLTPLSSVTVGIGDPTNQTVNFDVFLELLTTNNTGFFVSLSNLNQSLGSTFYRYESGTSMSAAEVSGMLVLMQEFFANLSLKPSPALMKALVINGARNLGLPYDLQVTAPNGNSQGWGLANLPNSIPAGLTNFGHASLSTLPVMFFDQDPTRALATGQSETRTFALTDVGQNQDMHITLVWTDPPGNPAAGTKLVNDLDLIVSNLDDPSDVQVFYGNDIQAGNVYNEPTDTNSAPNVDSVNNVENVLLQQPLGVNYSVTVVARRVNVNAVTATTNGIVQDYALVISSGDTDTNTNDPPVGSPFTGLTDSGVINAPNSVNPAVTNIYGVTNGVPLFNQRVGANSQFAGTNGTRAQWNFYVYTNTVALTNAAFTNVAFITFVPPNLGVPRMGASQEIGPPDTDATRFAGADIDMVVSGDPALTNLDPTVLAGIPPAFKSSTRTGTEKVLLTGSAPGQVYYIGVRSQDQQAAQFDFLAVATDLPFGQTDGNGNVVVTMLASFPVPIPPGGPSNPNHALVLGVSTSPVTVRKAVVTDMVTATDFGDLIGTLNHTQHTAVLNNHSFFKNVNDTNETFVYDDSGENEFPNTQTSDGPGSLRDFTGDMASDGVWMFTQVNDSSLSDTGKITDFKVTLEPQPPAGAFVRTIGGDSAFFDFVDVPPNATNLTISVVQSGANPLPVDLLIKRGDFPDFGSFDQEATLPIGGGSLSINKFQTPPLNAGRYFFEIFNPNPTPQTVTILVTVDLALAPQGAINFLSSNNVPILDDAVTYSTNHVSLDSAVVSADVGVRIDHPRESDLVLTLISPQGTRVLLAENRGGTDNHGYGSGTNMTNVFPMTTSGGLATTNFDIVTPGNSGTLIINYDFETVPDDLRVYYDGNRIFDSTLISGSGSFAVDFGPGNSSTVEIRMNEPGTNPSTNATDFWTYTASVVTRNTTYAFFTENTNLTTTPIKFAIPPFGVAGPNIPAVTNVISDFDSVAAGDYSNTTVNGWTVGSNAVKVVTVPALAAQESAMGGNVLALHGGTISRTLTGLITGQSYSFTFVNHGKPKLLPVSWYKGENDLQDTIGNNPGSVENNVSFVNGEVGKAFFLSPSNPYVLIPDAQSLHFSNSMTAEAWVFPTTVSQFNTIIARWAAVSGNGGSDAYTLSLGPGGAAYFAVNPTGNSGGQTASSTVNVPANQWSYVAGTYDGSSLKIYVNGILQGTTAYNQGIFAGTDQLALGINAGGENASFTIPGLLSPFSGGIDEATVYSNALSLVQIQDIYAAGSAGKCPPLGNCQVSATVFLGTATNTILGNDLWSTNVYTFIASNTNITVTIIPQDDGMLVDSFNLVKNPVLNSANYFLPEESLDKLVGESSVGDWKLEILDNRAGANVPQPVLLSWQLSMLLTDKIPFAFPLQHAIPNTNTVAPNSIAYYIVDVPIWAQFATNIFTLNSGSANLLFNQTILPTGTNFTDITLLSASGTRTLRPAGFPQLIPGQRYFLAVQNTTATPASFTIEVDFDITTLTNGVPLQATIQPLDNVPRYFQYDVTNPAAAAAFQVLQPSGSVELVVRKGPPLPDLVHFDYAANTVPPRPESVIVLTNSPGPSPVVLTPGRWYLGVFNTDSNPVTYNVIAKQAAAPTTTALTNDVTFTTTVAPGAALSNFFTFTIANSPSAVLFEVFNMSGDADLNLNPSTNNPPYFFPYFTSSPPDYASSVNLGTRPEEIVIRTNTQPADQHTNNLNGIYYLGVPNNTASNVTFTIHAVTTTNLLISRVPINVMEMIPPNPSPTGPTLTITTVLGECYQVQVSTNLINWITIESITGGSGLASFTDPSPVTNSPIRFYRIVQGCP